MTVLVDEARWPWRETLWCHLVSDDNLAELHAFAAQLGMRRVGFQGDHYDIDIEMRSVAIDLGATPATSRELIRRMRSAGLRLRPSSPFTKWALLQRSGVPGADPSAIAADSELAPLLEHSDGWFELTRPRAVGEQKEQAIAQVVFGIAGDHQPELPEEDDSVGLFSRIDHRGNWSVERITPSPMDSE